jgi:hypothetical protein
MGEAHAREGLACFSLDGTPRDVDVTRGSRVDAAAMGIAARPRLGQPACSAGDAGIFRRAAPDSAIGRTGPRPDTLEPPAAADTPKKNFCPSAT